MLVNSKILLKKAQEGHYAIPSANVIDMESIKNQIQLAEKLGLPLIAAVAESHLGSSISLEDAALVGRKYAAEASVPVVLHLDHGQSCPSEGNERLPRTLLQGVRYTGISLQNHSRNTKRRKSGMDIPPILVTFCIL